MDAIPTPFDIAPLPLSPFAPSALLWLLLLTILLIPTLIILIVSRRSPLKRFSLRAVTMQKLKKLQSSLPEITSHGAAAEGARLLRRFLAPHADLEALTAEELGLLATTSDTPLLQKVLPLLIEFDLIKYSPLVDPESLATLISRTLSALNQEGEE